KAKVVVKPEAKLGEYKGLEVPKANTEVSEEELTAELERLQQRHAELVVIEEGTAESGDIAVIDYEGSVDGELFDGGQAERHSLELGSNTFIPGFEEQVIGLSTGDNKDVEVTFPEEYHAAELAGKKAIFKVKVHEIKRKVLPAIDDEFAKDVSEFDTLAEYKEDLTKQLSERKAEEAKANQENVVVEKAAANAEVEIPQGMVNTEVRNMMRDFDNRLRQQGMNLEMFMSFSGQTEADLQNQMKGDAEKRVRNNLVLEAIGKQENIEVSDEDINEELNNMAASFRRTPEEIRQILESNGSFDSLREEALLRKTIDFLLANSVEVDAPAEEAAVEATEE
ncbi:trigger factor, partial [Paenibacillus sp. 453mf]|uniref:trigger factor n=1 Tax=Paenibacillus sp. 453mf TaxID=1761874 RepID=UPI0008F29DC7